MEREVIMYGKGRAILSIFKEQHGIVDNACIGERHLYGEERSERVICR